MVDCDMMMLFQPIQNDDTSIMIYSQNIVRNLTLINWNSIRFVLRPKQVSRKAVLQSTLHTSLGAKMTGLS